MFDLVVFSSFWPKGLLFSKKMAEQGFKVCYVNCHQENPPPFGVFLGEYDREPLGFLLATGELNQQKEGFSLLHPEGSWSFQETDRSLLSPYLSSSKTGCFKQDWVRFLSQNLTSPVFERNNFSSNQQSQDFCSDYYLFSPASKKQLQFKETYPQIHFKEACLDSIRYSDKKSEASFLVDGQPLEASQFVWFVDPYDLLKVFSDRELSNSQKPLTPHWEWSSFAFEGVGVNYESIIPSHFISLHQLSWPWTHSNLLSVFYNSSHWDVWVRQPYGQKNLTLEDDIQAHLSHLFKKSVFFKPMNKKRRRSFLVYGEEALNQTKNPFSFLLKNVLIPKESSLLAGDLASHLKYENQWAQSGEWIND